MATTAPAGKVRKKIGESRRRRLRGLTIPRNASQFQVFFLKRGVGYF